MTAVLHLTNHDHPGKRYAIEQGATYRKFTILYETDISSWAVTGQIRDNYRDRSGVLIADLSFPALEYKSVLVCGVARMRTLIIPTLTATVTDTMGQTWVSKGMERRSQASDVPLIGKNAWVYDIEVSDGSEVIRVAQGFVEMDLGVTDA